MKLSSQNRLALSIFFFLSGVNFASWTSRIPTIKEGYHLNDAELGAILLAMPISSLVGLPFSGWLVSRFETRVPMLIALLGMTASLFFIGYVNSIPLLIVSISVFSFCMRIINIAMNTQSINLQRLYTKKIVGSFHGLWSLGGLVGVGVSTLMVKLQWAMTTHFAIISLSTLVIAFLSYQYCIKQDRSETGNKLILGKPDMFIMYLGLMVFFAAICEGGMFDWSGVYFKDVIKAEVFTYGYLIFISCMSLSRFCTDKIIDIIGMKRTFTISALLIVTGILVAIIWPMFWTALVGFCMVGLGTAAVFPITFMLTGDSKKYSPGMAISIVATYGIVGAFIGPPVIGFLSHAFNLQVAFLVFALAGFLLIPISRMFFKFKEQQN